MRKITDRVVEQMSYIAWALADHSCTTPAQCPALQKAAADHEGLEKARCIARAILYAFADTTNAD